MGRIVLLGLDGSSLDIIKPLVEQYNLENFRTVLDNGLAGPLESVIPYVSPPGWASIFSGVNPGKHGCFDLFNFNGLATHVTNMRESNTPFLWDRLSKSQLRVIVLGMPFTHPATKVNGIFVTGYPTPISTHPRDLGSRLKSEGYTIDVPKMNNGTGSNREIWVEKIISLFKTRMNTSLKIMDDETWDAFILVDNITDMAQHLVLADQELIGKVYAEVDILLGHLLRRLRNDDLIMIVSDHGCRSAARSFVLNQWLWENGFLTPKKSMMKGFYKRASSNFDELLNNRAVKESFSGKTRSFTKSFIGLVAPFILSSLFEKSTKAFSIGTNEAVAWIKVLPKDADEKKRITSDIKSKLKKLKSKEGDLIFKSVLEPSDAYHGPMVESAPGDLLVESSDGLLITNWGDSNDEFFSAPPTAREGIHSSSGVFVAYGRGIPRGNVSANVCDITPTILKYFGLDVPNDIDGNPIDALSNGRSDVT